MKKNEKRSDVNYGAVMIKSITKFFLIFVWEIFSTPFLVVSIYGRQKSIEKNVLKRHFGAFYDKKGTGYK